MAVPVPTIMYPPTTYGISILRSPIIFAPTGPIEFWQPPPVTLADAEFEAITCRARRKPVPDWALERLAESTALLIGKALAKDRKKLTYTGRDFGSPEGEREYVAEITQDVNGTFVVHDIKQGNHGE